MIPVERLIKAEWAQRQFGTALALLPSGSGLAIQLGRLRLFESGPGVLAQDTPGVTAYPVLLEGQPVGSLLLQLSGPVDTEQAQKWGEFLCHTLQSKLDAENVRRAVSRETLESYRELALLQRAVFDLNRSLKPAAVVAALLKEFDAQKSSADFGVVLTDPDGSGQFHPDQTFGRDGDDAVADLMQSRWFASMSNCETGDIVNDLSASEQWAGQISHFQSLLWLPLISHGNRLGLLVLASYQTEGFSAADLKRAQTLASVAATALRNAKLYAAEQRLFQSFVQMIATTIDAKSPYTAGHCRRVPEIAMMLADCAHRSNSATFADFVMSDEDRNALEIAAMLHDCGKVVTPEWVVDKANKLDSIVNRIDLISLRYEILRRDAEAAYQMERQQSTDEAQARQTLQERLRQIDSDLAFLKKCNQGTEFITPAHLARIQSIAQQHWTDSEGSHVPVLTENEAYNLSIPRGTLNPRERKIIEDHAVHTINMLSQMTFPHSLRNVTEYAAGHHERIDGCGYPRGLTGEQLSIPARIMAIADIFEALTAPDRPYRRPSTLSWAIDTMHKMRLDRHIDSDLFDLFLSEKIYLIYARKYLQPQQIDEVHLAPYLTRQTQDIQC